MKRLLSITALALVIALSLAFTGCSGAQKDASAYFQGSWKMTNVAGATEDDIAAMEAFGMNVVLDLNEDKTAVLDVMGEEISGTWEAKSSTELTLTIEGSSVTGKLNGEELTIAVDGEEMTFQKVSAEEAAKIKEDAASMEGILSDEGDDATSADSGVTYDASFTPVTVVDDDMWTIDVVAKKSDEWGDTGYVVDVNNKSDKSICVTVPSDVCSVNGKMVEFWGSEVVLPGKLAEGAFFYADSDDVASVSEMTNVEMVIEVWDNDTYETLASYDVTLN